MAAPDHMYLIDRRIGDLICTYPVESSSSTTTAILLDSIMFHHTVTEKDFDVLKTWTPRTIMSISLKGPSFVSMKQMAIRLMGGQSGLKLFDVSLEDQEENVFVEFSEKEYTYYLVWKRSVNIGRIREAMWRDRKYLCLSDFIPVAKLDDTFDDLSMVRENCGFKPIDERTSYVIKTIASNLKKQYVEVAPSDPYSPSQWDMTVSRSNIPPEQWVNGHPYFRSAPYVSGGFLNLDTKIITSREDKTRYNMLVSKTLTKELHVPWRNDILERIKVQLGKYRECGFHIYWFAQLEEWSIVELVYFFYHPPPALFTDVKDHVWKRIDSKTHVHMHFEKHNWMEMLCCKKACGNEVIMKIQNMVIDHFGMREFKYLVPITTEEKHFVAGMSNIRLFMSAIAEKYTMPISSLYIPSRINKDEYSILSKINEAVIYKNNPHQNVGGGGGEEGQVFTFTGFASS